VTSRRTMLGGAASLGLLVAARHVVGQRPVKLFRIGYLSLRAGPNAWDEAFVQSLREYQSVGGNGREGRGAHVRISRQARYDAARFGPRPPLRPPRHVASGSGFDVVCAKRSDE
jgi:hypothetical protein